tara:strand:+ start:339 stop:725 length:387 start_codon:yes stop_codon:yes gene_type:complete
MSKVSNKQILEINQALKYIASQDIEAWYQIGRNIKKVEPIVTELSDSRQSIISKFVKKDADGNWLHKDEAKIQWDLGDDQVKADELWEEIQKEERTVEFFTFGYEVLASTKLNPQAVTPLLDTVIVEK